MRSSSLNFEIDEYSWIYSRTKNPSQLNTESCLRLHSIENENRSADEIGFTPDNNVTEFKSEHEVLLSKEQQSLKPSLKHGRTRSCSLSDAANCSIIVLQAPVRTKSTGNLNIS